MPDTHDLLYDVYSQGGYNGENIMFRALIFDMDGVLVDSMSYHTRAMAHVFSQMGIRMNKQDIYDLEGSKTVDIVRVLLKKDGVDPATIDLEGLLQNYQEEFDRIVEMKVFGELTSILPTLKSHYLLALVSGADRVIVHDIVRRLFPSTFDVVITGEDLTHGKPAPDPFLRAAEVLGVDREECLVVENAPMGVKSAKRAGMFCVAVPTYVEKNTLLRADLIIEDHRELAKYLLELEHSGTPDR